MNIVYNVTGAERKRLATTLGQILGYEPVYQGVPSFVYTVGNYTVDRNGVISCPDSATPDICRTIIEGLRAEGFTTDSTPEEDMLVIAIPRNLLSDDALQRLEQIIAGKSELFKMAFQTDALLLEKDENEIRFPWFHLTGEDGEAEAYGNFVTRLWQMANQRQRITAKPYDGDNPKFTMRLFLVQLVLKGPQYKQTRKILLQHLTGNSAWRYGAPPERRSSGPTLLPTPDESLDRYSEGPSLEDIVNEFHATPSDYTIYQPLGVKNKNGFL